MRFIFKYPSKGRPEKIQSTYRRWNAMASGLHEIFWILSFDNGDDQDIEWLQSLKHTRYHFSDNKGKVSAVNADLIDLPDYDVLIIVSDDMIPQVQGYDDIIAERMQLYFPELDGLLWLADGKQIDVCTLAIMGRKLYEYFGYVYHPSYQSLFCDNEQTEVCRRLGKLVFMDDVIIRHEWGMGDELEKHNESFWQVDEANWEKEKKRRISVGIVEE